MKEIRRTSQFKKDFKRISKNPKKFQSLYAIVNKLRNNEEIPSEFNPHALRGEWNGFMECHIEDDFLLIWYDQEENVVMLVRLGTHSELFGKRRKR